MEELQVKSAIGNLLAGAGLDAGNLAVEASAGGGNNRVLTVFTGDAKYLAKIYYSHPMDRRNRLGAEFSFLSYAWDIGLRCVPRPISADKERNIGLYEFVEGQKLTAQQLTTDHIQQATHFCVTLNARSGRDRASILASASEACFSVSEQFALVDGRVERLRELPGESELDRQAQVFVAEIYSTWQAVKAKIARALGHKGLETVLDDTDRCISPSDFGFHNALRRNSGDVCFIDFEYAGWDDPAKLVGDFFSQPAVPVPPGSFDMFLQQAMSYSPHAGALVDRARMLLPVFQVKWCCIMLNEFLPDAARRRRFANSMTEPELSKRLQLEKAKHYFHSKLQ